MNENRYSNTHCKLIKRICVLFLVTIFTLCMCGCGEKESYSDGVYVKFSPDNKPKIVETEKYITTYTYDSYSGALVDKTTIDKETGVIIETHYYVTYSNDNRKIDILGSSTSIIKNGEIIDDFYDDSSGECV